MASLITRDEEDQILAKREDVLKDRKLLETIADRTGSYIDLEVGRGMKPLVNRLGACNKTSCEACDRLGV